MKIDQKHHAAAIAKTKQQLSIAEVIAQDGPEIAKLVYLSRRQHLAAAQDTASQPTDGQEVERYNQRRQEYRANNPTNYWQ